MLRDPALHVNAAASALTDYNERMLLLPLPAMRKCYGTPPCHATLFECDLQFGYQLVRWQPVDMNKAATARMRVAGQQALHPLLQRDAWHACLLLTLKLWPRLIVERIDFQSYPSGEGLVTIAPRHLQMPCQWHSCSGGLRRAILRPCS